MKSNPEVRRFIRGKSDPVSHRAPCDSLARFVMWKWLEWNLFFAVTFAYLSIYPSIYVRIYLNPQHWLVCAPGSGLCPVCVQSVHFRLLIMPALFSGVDFAISRMKWNTPFLGWTYLRLRSSWWSRFYQRLVFFFLLPPACVVPVSGSGAPCDIIGHSGRLLAKPCCSRLDLDIPRRSRRRANLLMRSRVSQQQCHLFSVFPLLLKWSYLQQRSLKRGSLTPPILKRRNQIIRSWPFSGNKGKKRIHFW